MLARSTAVQACGIAPLHSALRLPDCPIRSLGPYDSTPASKVCGRPRWPLRAQCALDASRTHAITACSQRFPDLHLLVARSRCAGQPDAAERALQRREGTVLGMPCSFSGFSTPLRHTLIGDGRRLVIKISTVDLHTTPALHQRTGCCKSAYTVLLRVRLGDRCDGKEPLL